MNLYPGSVIDTLATVRRVGDHPESKISLKCLRMHSDSTIFLKKNIRSPAVSESNGELCELAAESPYVCADLIYNIEGGLVLILRSPAVVPPVLQPTMSNFVSCLSLD